MQIIKKQFFQLVYFRKKKVSVAPALSSLSARKNVKVITDKHRPLLVVLLFIIWFGSIYIQSDFTGSFLLAGKTTHFVLSSKTIETQHTVIQSNRPSKMSTKVPRFLIFSIINYWLVYRKSSIVNTGYILQQCGSNIMAISCLVI